MNYGKTQNKKEDVLINSSSILYKNMILGNMLLVNNIYCSNANDAVNPGIQIYNTDGSTLNTPYKQGMTVATQGMLLSCVYGDYGTQLALQNGSNSLYVRGKNGGTWGSWVAK